MSEFAVMPLEDYKSICDYLREAGGSSAIYVSGDITDAINTRLHDAYSAGQQEGYEVGYETGHSVGFEDGKNSVPPIDRVLSTAEFKSLQLFGVPDVVLNLDNMTNLRYLFGNNPPNTIVEHLTINCPNQVGQAFGLLNLSEDTTLKHLTLNVDFQKAAGWNAVIDKTQALEIIDGYPINCLSATSGLQYNFRQCYALREIRFVPNSIFINIWFGESPLLSAESIQSIIAGLANLTGQATQTLTVHKDIYSKIIDNGWDALITAKNWTLVKA